MDRLSDLPIFDPRSRFFQLGSAICPSNRQFADIAQLHVGRYKSCRLVRNLMSLVLGQNPRAATLILYGQETFENINKAKLCLFQAWLGLFLSVTVDKLAFIKLNGPPLGLKKIFKNALTPMFKGQYANHFTHSNILGATSTVVCRITEGKL